MSTTEQPRPRYLYKRINCNLFVRFDPSAPPGSPQQFTLLRADLAPPLVPVQGPVRLSHTAQAPPAPPEPTAEQPRRVRKPGTYLRL